MTFAPSLGALFRRLTEGRLTPWVKQIPTVVTFAAAMVVLWCTRMPLESAALCVTSAALVAGGTAASALLPWRRLDARWSVLIPCASFVAVGLLLVATGGTDSPFGVLLVMPLIWVASEEGPWNPLIAGVGVCVALLLPAAVSPADPTLGDLARDVLTPFVYIVAAIIVNEVARRLREAAAATNRVKDEFVGLVSHELRNPLTSVIGYLQLMRMDPSPLTEAQRGYIGVAERNAHRLQQLVGDLLFTAQVGGGAFPLQLQPTDLDEVVRLALESAGPAAEEAGVVLTAELAASVTLDADPERLGQAVDNLVSNAIKFTPAGGTITVTTRATADAVELAVRDNGIGIPTAELEHLSERFYRASSATSNAIPGVGLGLTVVRSIVAAHGGTMDVDSEVGAGTVFTVRLPRTRRG